MGYSKSDLQIFSQVIQDFLTVGIFGNADTAYTADWSSVLFDNIQGITEAEKDSIWTEIFNFCQH